ncbi:ImmA/IrrE family metallo-endopeptidase [Tissierella sp.]|uniref:ImmA/IrrE family metallo-endopeptidase n=1 Tax=Tissierella sp. TaxID=41274 RepID=UPI00306F36C1
MNKEIIEIRDGLIELYKTKDPFELCRSLGVKVVETDLGDNILGFFQRVLGEEVIYLNNRIEDFNEKEYVCFHELGHVVCHPELSICFLEKIFYIKDKYENEADIFAAYFLIPDNDDIDIYEIENMTTKQLSSYFKVPEKLIKLRFKELSL